MARPFQYLFERKQLPTTPGTGNYVFQPFQSLPLFSAGGPGITYLHGMRSIQEPQRLVEDAQVVDGFNGITTGDVGLTGLVDLPEHMQQQQMLLMTDTLFKP